MLIRKINAALSLLVTLLLLDHAGFYSVWMISMGTIEKTAGPLPWIFFGLMMVHGVISLGLVISTRLKGPETEKDKVKAYPKLNGSTYFQRISGILLIVLTVLHVAGATGLMVPPRLIHAIVPPVFFTIALGHVAVSTSKAFVTLGIGNAKFIKAVDILMKVVCAALLIASLVGFYLYKV